MAATSHPLATLAAIDALRAGGSAADAAVAAVATLCVVEPHMTGIGGDCYCLVSQPGKPVWGYNGSGRAGAKASYEALRAKGMSEIGNSIHAVTVPGALDAWEAILKAHGRFGLDRALAPAIKYAEGGFPVARARGVGLEPLRRQAQGRSGRGQALSVQRRGAEGRRRDPLSGAGRDAEDHRRQGRARLLRGRDRRRTWWRRWRRAARSSRRRISRATAATRSTPISTNYRGLDLIEIPPNGQGLTALVMLNILENFDLAALDPLGPERFHLVLEAARLGFAVRDTHIADAAHMRIAVADLLDKGFAKKLAAKIDMTTPRQAADGADARQRHGLSQRGRPRPHGGVVHQYALFAFRRRHLHREDRHPADQSRRLLHARAGSPQHLRSRQAADAHHHSGAGHAGRAAAT